jgi:HEAT repeat protein
MTTPVAREAFDRLLTGDEVWEPAKLLVNLRDTAVVPQLISLMASDSDIERRTAAAWTLGAMRAETALDPLLRILDDASQPSKLRDHAAEALGCLWDPRARPVVLRHLDDPDPDVVFSCAYALREVGTLDDIPRLQELAHTSHLTTSYGRSVATEATDAIQRIQERFDEAPKD